MSESIAFVYRRFLAGGVLKKDEWGRFLWIGGCRFVIDYDWKCETNIALWGFLGRYGVFEEVV